MPAIIYGKDINLPIKIPYSELKILKAHHFSETALVEILLDSSDKIECIIKDVQFHPLTEEVIHLDFMKVSLKEMVRVKVPIEIKGEENIKEGVVEQMLWELEIESLPLEIPEKIVVDVSSLKIGDSFHVKDLKLGEEVKIVTDPEETIVTVLAAEEVTEEEGASSEEEKEPEVIKEKKTEES